MAKGEVQEGGWRGPALERRYRKDLRFNRAVEIVKGFETAVDELDFERQSIFEGIFKVLAKIKLPGFGSLNQLRFPVQFRRADTAQSIMQLLEFSFRQIHYKGPLFLNHPGSGVSDSGARSSGVASVETFSDELSTLMSKIYADFAEILIRAGIVNNLDDGDDVDKYGGGDFFEGDLYKLQLKDKEGKKSVVPAYCKGVADGSECFLSGAKVPSNEPIFYFNPECSADPFYKIGKEYLRQENDADVYWWLVGYTKNGELIGKFLRRESMSRPRLDETAYT